jgi:hypothetical protein
LHVAGCRRGIWGSGVGEGFEGKAEVVEDLWIVRGLGVEVGEDPEGGGKVAGGKGVVGLLDESGLRRRLSVGVGEVLRGQVGGEDGAEDCGDAREGVGAGLRCEDWRGESFGG